MTHSDNYCKWVTKSINQSIKIYIAPLQDPYSEALPTQASLDKVVELRTGTVWLGGALDLLEVHSIGCWNNHRKERVCIVTEWESGTTKLPRPKDRSV